MKKIIKRHRLIIVALLLLLIGALIFAITQKFISEKITGAVLAQVRVVGGQFPPQFDHDLTNQSVNQSKTLTYDINCSDIEPADMAVYFDNSTLFEINLTTGVINHTGFNQSDVGFHTINITCSDNKNNVTDTFVLEIIDDNAPPVLAPIGPQLALTDIPFILDVDATDMDHDVLTYGENTSLFAMAPATGFVNFTAAVPDIGNHTINMTVFDGFLYDYEDVLLTIVQGPFCGDGGCGSKENCQICAADCGACPEPPPAEQAEEIGQEQEEESSEEKAEEGEGGAIPPQPAKVPPPPPQYRCDEKWECTPWQPPVCPPEQIQIRVCKDINECGTTSLKPEELQACEYQPTCDDSIQNQGEESVDCGGPCPPCKVPSCTDGIQNQDEQGIDCGGPCAPCEIKKFAKIPVIELPAEFEIPKQFPWILLLIISILDSMLVSGDQTYVRRLRKKPFEEYREKRWLYRPLRRKIYTFIINSFLITAVASTYIYLLSDNFEKLVALWWLPCIIILIIPVCVSVLLRHLTYYDYQRRMKEHTLKQTHRSELLQLMHVETKLLADIESDFRKRFYEMVLGKEFESVPAAYTEFHPTYSIMSKLVNQRTERLEIAKISAAIYAKMTELLEIKSLEILSKDYPEFRELTKILRVITQNIDRATYDKELLMLDLIDDISQPHMISVISTRQSYITLYNTFVDLYHYFKTKHKELHEKDAEISHIERQFTDVVKDIAKKPIILDTVAHNENLISLYNSMVDLFNHYTKKLELGNKINIQNK